MMKRFTPYEGSRPYIFISYSRADNEKMLDTMNVLREKNYRLWYDEGIPAGDDWPRYISDHLNSSAAVVFFFSAGSMVSPNCYSELIAALRQGKSIICILLDESASLVAQSVRDKRKLTEQERKLIDSNTRPFALRRKSNIKIPTADNWAEALVSSEFIDGDCDSILLSEKILSQKTIDESFIGEYQGEVTVGSKFNGWMAGILLGIVLLGFLLYTGIKAYENVQSEPVQQTVTITATPKPTVEPGTIPGLNNEITPPDNQQAKAIRYILNKNADEAITGEELAQITGFAVCGKTVTDVDTIITCVDGDWYLGTGDNKVKVVKGSISDLSVIGQMYYLENLVLVNQDINSIAKLSNLQVLTRLDISGNPISTLNLKDGFNKLETLNISHTQIRNLENINAPESLKTVYVSVDMLDKLTLDKEASYEVVLVK